MAFRRAAGRGDRGSGRVGPAPREEQRGARRAPTRRCRGSPGLSARCSHPRAQLLPCACRRAARRLCISTQTRTAVRPQGSPGVRQERAGMSRERRSHGCFLFRSFKRPLPSRPPVPSDGDGATSEVKVVGPQLREAERSCTHSVEEEAEAGKWGAPRGCGRRSAELRSADCGFRWGRCVSHGFPAPAWRRSVVQGRVQGVTDAGPARACRPPGVVGPGAQGVALQALSP